MKSSESRSIYSRTDRSADDVHEMSTAPDQEEVNSVPHQAHQAKLFIGERLAEIFWCPLAQMLLYLALGVGAWIGHHFFCLHFNNRQVNTTPILGLQLSKQSLLSAAGNVIAFVGKSGFALAITVVVEQVFWVTLKTRAHTITEIDGIMDRRSSLMILSKSGKEKLLTPIAFLGTVMFLVSTFAPGALGTVTTYFGPDVPCTIPQANLSLVDIRLFSGSEQSPSPALLKMALTNLISGDFIPYDSPCGSCSYNVSLDAPAMNCTNATDSSPIPITQTSTTQVIIWNATHNLGSGGSSIIVATEEAYGQRYEAAICNFYHATYSLHVQHNNSHLNISVNGSTFHDPITVSALNPETNPGDAQRYYIALALAEHLFGVSTVDLSNMFPAPPPMSQNDNHNMFYSALGRPDPSGTSTWQWKPSVQESLPQLMQNISLSMLSNPLRDVSISNITQTCQITTVVYQYNKHHLFLVYGPASGVTFICVVIGCWAMIQNEKQETLLFSRILSSAIYPGSTFNNAVDLDTPVRAEMQGEALVLRMQPAASPQYATQTFYM